MHASPARIERRDVDGVLLLDKPSGMTSTAALAKAKWLLRAKRAGHTGTLDPLASGLLPLCFGEATRFAQRLLDAPKGYLATIRFGVATTTGDAEGEVTATTPVGFTREALEATLARFVGEQMQVPPMYSALKVGGQPLYRLARAGHEIERAPRRIVVHALACAGWEPPVAQVTVTCSKGTYVRVLAEDIGRTLGVGAHLAALRRTTTGGFRIEDAITLEALADLDDAARIECLRSTAALVADLPALVIGTPQAQRFLHGQAVPAGAAAVGEHAVYAGGRLLGLAQVAAGVAQPSRVLAGAQAAMEPD
ncbi:MAG: tRNA pseudouridine(55) synthase TruB [Burkholderiales bacterium]|nr:tRNA pseudouridine(55) synthase TruB [Burkholderiales bacterium]